MDPRSILLAMLPVGMTLINYAIVRDLLWGIFLGNKSRKTADKIKAEQTFMSKWLQSYIPPHLTKYQKEFSKWTVIKRLVFALTIAQIIAFVLMIVLSVPFWIVGIVVGGICLFDVILFIIMMNRTATSDAKTDRKGAPWEFEQGQSAQKVKKRR